jgi:hypothetical protein
MSSRCSRVNPATGQPYVADPMHLLRLHDAVEKVNSGAIKPLATRRSSGSEVTSDTRNCSYCEKFRVTKVTFTPQGAASTMQLVVWQFWGRAAEASLTEKSRALF